ncbi:MAG: hypothetical protein WC382_12435 [Methanoregulaceae archaeon]|jgi:hypothetical protein
MTGGIRQAVRLLFTPGQVIEVRAISDDGVASGYFDDPEQLASQVATLDGLPGVQGIYVTLNEVNPALLARRANRIRTRLSKKDATTADADILRRRWFPIDVDPVRPSGVSSTDAEHQAALDTAVRVADYLDGMGWPAPVAADSGNGAHLLYRIDLPNDDACRDLVKRCLGVLAALFDDDRTTIDPANHNAARIWKLYGTVTRKGDTTGDRPHRRSRILPARGEVTMVSRQLLEQLAAAFPATPPDPAPPRARGAQRPLILADWLRDHGIPARSEKPYQGGTLFVLDRCPFSASHRDGAFAIQFGNGAIHAGCHHASCGGGTQRWQELRERFGPVARPQKPGPVRPPSVPGIPATGPRAPASPDDLPGREEALAVLEHGDPLAYLLEVFGREHVGDEILARCMILSMATQAVANTDGLHVSVTGESGKGKTHAFRTMLRQVPDRYKLKSTMSNKALYYMPDLSPRTVLVCDDTDLPDGIQEILKSATSSFREPISHASVGKDLTLRNCTIPERCIWWIAKKEGAGDDQVMNRMLTCWIDESPEQDLRVLAAKQEKEQHDPDTIPDETPGLAICRAIWQILHEVMIWVVIPFSEWIRFHAADNRRNPDMLYDLIKGHAVLSFLQREQKTARNGTLCISATEEDFSAANEIFTRLNGTAGGQESKMTRRESDLVAAIRQAQQDEVTVQDLQKLTGWSYASIYRTIKGYECRGRNYTGLLEKCPALSLSDRTVTALDGQGNPVRRRSDAFQWDQELFRQWNGSGSCWLDPDRKGGGGSLPALQQLFSSFPASAVNQDGGSDGPDSCNTTDNDDNSVLRKGIFQQYEKYGDAVQPGLAGSQCLHDPKNAATEDQNPANAARSGNSSSQCVPIVSSTCCKTGENVLENRLPAAKDTWTIHAQDYKPLDIPEHTPCFVCGAPWSHHIEKLTGSRKARQKDQQQARRICKACYRTAKVKAQMAAQVLPGAFVVSRLERLKFPVGRCTVCELDTAVYIDRSTDAKICEFCYQRAIQPRDHGEVAG